jgi:hypothetical protein
MLFNLLEGEWFPVGWKSIFFFSMKNFPTSIIDGDWACERKETTMNAIVAGMMMV